MSEPILYVLLDTSVFRRQQFNFESEAFLAFREKVRDQKLRLVLPEMVELEVHDQIAKFSLQANEAIEKAHRAASGSRIARALLGERRDITEDVKKELMQGLT